MWSMNILWDFLPAPSSIHLNFPETEHIYIYGINLDQHNILFFRCSLLIARRMQRVCWKLPSETTILVFYLYYLSFAILSFSCISGERTRVRSALPRFRRSSLGGFRSANWKGQDRKVNHFYLLKGKERMSIYLITSWRFYEWVFHS